MIKLIGAILIIASSIILGVYSSSLFGKKTSDMQNQISFYIKLKDKMTSYPIELSNAIEECFEDFDFDFKMLFEKLIFNMRTKDYQSYSEATNHAFNEYKSIYLNKNDIDAVKRLMKSMDSSGNQGFINALDEHISYIKKELDKWVENEQKNKKLYFNLWMYAGIIVVVVLI